MKPGHLAKMTKIGMSGIAGTMLLCSCQQIDSIASQQADVKEFYTLPQVEKKFMIDEWHNMISLKRKTQKHYCFIRYQHALKNLAQLLQDGQYKATNQFNYEQIIQNYFHVANSSTNLNFMTECLEDKSKTNTEITNIRRTAAASLVSLNDDTLFDAFLKEYSNAAYEMPIQLILADGLIKYHSTHKANDTCAEIIVKTMVLKQRDSEYMKKKEIEHLTGLNTNLSTLNGAISQAKNNTRILELVLDLNLKFWRKLQNQQIEFSEQAALKNIGLLKSLLMNPVSSRVKELAYSTLCEIAPAEYLAVLNTKLENDPSFDNMKQMLLFLHSLQNKGMKTDQKFTALSNVDKTIKKTKTLARNFIINKTTGLTSDKQKEVYEIYAKILPDQVYAFLCVRFIRGKETVSFYETAINAILWMNSQKIYTAEKASDLENVIDKLLFSCRTRSDYKKIFELVFANKATCLNQWKEMITAAGKSDIIQKDAFVDSFITLISKIKSTQKIPADFTAKNRNVFQYIISSLDARAILKLIPYLENNGEKKFLLIQYFVSAFDKRKLNSSTAHLSVAGDLAFRHITELKKIPRLYTAYQKLFFSGIANKDNEVSILCADYYFRITDPGDVKAIEQGKKEFSARWPNLHPVSQRKKN